jgi:hypothetical protein
MVKSQDEKIEEELLTPKTSEELNAEIANLEELNAEIAKLEELKYALEFEENQILNPVVIENDFTKLAKGECYSLNCIYKAFNDKTKVSTKVNGKFIDNIIGLDEDKRSQVLVGNISKVFSIGDFKFEFLYFEKI